ncbi:MAG: hypothetical protein MMC23_000800 [Stictis urceolatum]|nr:hypothetical protein [Stictis urceolata]
MLRLTRTRSLVAIVAITFSVYVGNHMRANRDDVASDIIKPPLHQSFEEVTTFVADPSTNCTARLPPSPLPLQLGRDLWSSIYTIFQSHPASLGEDISPDGNIPHHFLPPFSPLSASRVRSTHVSVAEALSRSWTGAFHGLGIVMLGGGPRDEFTATVLGMLRVHGTTLSLEIWFRDRKSWEHEEKKWCEEMHQKGFSVACRLLSDYVDRPINWKRKGAGQTSVLQTENQQILAAIMLSSFKHVLYLSPDAIPIMNLDGIFMTPGFQSEGAVFWRDFWETQWGKWGRYVLGVGDEAVEYSEDNRGDYSAKKGLESREKTTLDKGLFMLDKSRHWKVCSPFHRPSTYPFTSTPRLSLAQSNKQQTLLLSLYHTHYPTLFAPLLSADAPYDRLLSASLHASLLSLRQAYHIVPSGPEQIPRGTKDSQPTGSGVSVLFHFPTWDPSSPADTSMAFLKTSIVRFGVRDLMCDKTCIDSPPLLRDNEKAIGGGKGGSALPYPLSSLVNKFTFPPALVPQKQAPLRRKHPRPSPRQRMIGTQVRTMGAVATRSDPLFGVLNEGTWVLSRQRLREKGGSEIEGVEERIWRVLERVGCEGEGLGQLVAAAGGKESGLCRNVRAYLGKALGKKGEKRVERWRGCARKEGE